MTNEAISNLIDEKFISRMMGYAYCRTQNSYDAEDLCSEIIYEIMRSLKKGNKIENINSYVRRVADHVYADFCEKRRKDREHLAEDSEEALLSIPAEENDADQDSEKLKWILGRISFLSKAYRDVMIKFYLEGKSIALIADELDTTETAVRQRLFSARQEIISEVKTMDTIKKPISFETIDFELIGTGKPTWGDPRLTLRRQLSKQVVWMCKEKARTAKEISELLNVPMIYVEEELEILVEGEKNGYGILRKTANGKYCHNAVILDTRQKNELMGIYEKHADEICDTIIEYLQEHKEEYLSFPYINREVPENLVFWLHTHSLGHNIGECVARVMREKYFKDYPKHDRQFSVFGYLDDGTRFGCGWDQVNANNICGYKNIELSNLYDSVLNIHFHCGLNIGSEKKYQLVFLAVNGLEYEDLDEEMCEQAAFAISEGLLYRDGDKLYTRILGFRLEDRAKLYSIDEGISEKIKELSEKIAEEIDRFIRKEIPKYLLTEVEYVNGLASLPLVDQLINRMVAKGFIMRPVAPLGPEGVSFGIE